MSSISSWVIMVLGVTTAYHKSFIGLLFMLMSLGKVLVTGTLFFGQVAEIYFF